ncbi:MAG: transcriptional regulator [Sporichthya sp.]|nr:transcriptional regulator [Sporichthya sp.]
MPGRESDQRDVLGERWALLVIRELLLGPKRFKHLLTALPAAGTNRLTDRLHGLEEAGIIRRTVLPPPAGVAAYELTSAGERLREPLLALGLWGLDLAPDDRIDPGTARAELIALCLTGTQAAPLDPSRRDTFEFQIGEEVFHLRLQGSSFLARSGPAPEDATLHVSCDLPTFVALALRQLSPTQALKSGLVTILQGNRSALTEVFRALGYTPTPGSAHE